MSCAAGHPRTSGPRWRSAATCATTPRRRASAFWGGLAYLLEGLADAQWERAGTHPERGVITVRSRTERQVAHAKAHLAQIRAIRQQV